MSVTVCKVVPYAPRHLDPVLALLGDGRRALWPWQYGWGAERSSVVAEDEAGNVIGFNGCMPVKVMLHGAVTDAVWSCDFVVDPHWRKRGVGRAMKQHLQDLHPLIMALGISDAGAAVHGRAGWVPMPDVPQYSFQHSIRNGKHLARRMLQAAMRLAGAARPVRHPAIEVNVLPAAQLPGDIETLWSRVEPTHGVVVRRNESYLRWRYVAHPVAKYQLIVVRRGGELQAVGVFRHGRTRSTLVDYMGPATDVGLKAAVVDRFVAECGQADRLTCVTSDPGLRQALLRRGFHSWGHRPLRFNVWCSSRIQMAAGPWFVMGGDSDGDLLAAARESA